MTALLVLVLALTPVALWISRRRANRGPHIIDLGLAFSVVVLLYSLLPIVGITLARFGVGDVTDGRLPFLPDEELVAEAGWCYAAFMVAFAMTYGWTRDRSGVRKLWIPSRADTIRVISFYVVLKVSLALAALVLDIRQAEDYALGYLALENMPLVVRQVLGVMYAIEIAAALLAVTTIIAFRPKLHWIALLIVLLQIVAALVEAGARTPAFLSLFAYLVARSLYRPMGRLAFALAVCLGLVAFAVIGSLRGGETDGGLWLLQSGEFVLVFDNALDLIERGVSAADIGMGGLYLVDLMRLIPQQIASDKFDPAALYVQTFYPAYAQAGGGLAFGAIAESVLGDGWMEAGVRGALLGLAYAFVANRCLRGDLTGVKLFIYVWFVVVSYQSVRDTTFTTFPRFMFQVAPMLALLYVSGTFRKRRQTSSQDLLAEGWRRRL